MITRYQAPNVIRQVLPYAPDQPMHSRCSLEIYVMMNHLVDRTKEAAEDHDNGALRKYFLLANELYKEGDRLVRLLISNIYVHSFSAFFPSDRMEREIFKSLIPVSLYRIYLKQVGSTAD